MIVGNKSYYQKGEGAGGEKSDLGSHDFMESHNKGMQA